VTNYTARMARLKLLPLLSLSALLGSRSKASAQAPAVPDEIRIAYSGGPRTWILGQIDGSYEKNFGTKVKWVQFGAGGEVISLLAANQIDMAEFGSSPTVTGLARKLAIKVISVPEIVTTNECLIGRTSAGVNALQDIVGKNVGYSPSSTTQYALDAAVSVHGLDRTKINLVSMPADAMPAAWSRGVIDAAYTLSPVTQQLEAHGGKRIFATEDLQKDGYLVYINGVVRKEFAEKYPHLVTAFLKTGNQKLADYRKDPTGATAAIAKFLSISVQAAHDGLTGVKQLSLQEQLVPEFLGSAPGQADTGIVKACKRMADFLVTVGGVRQQDVPDSFASTIDISFAQDAIKGA
jgi:taurine transport system substrate-binding protein